VAGTADPGLSGKKIHGHPGIGKADVAGRYSAATLRARRLLWKIRAGSPFWRPWGIKLFVCPSIQRGSDQG
ncbi:MAG: hypothetical protein ACREPK_02110, partial [Rhodanobacteraceae bacterium]